MTPKKLIEQIVSLYKENKIEDSPDCFLSVVHRDNDETTVSKLIAYMFAKVPSLANRVIAHYYKLQGNVWDEQSLTVESIECERVITARKRIDIFVTLTSDEGKRYCIVIENKVRSHENGGQTLDYESWATNYYSDCKVIYIYLKPSWNISTPVSNEFAILTFSGFSSMIENSENNYIVADFKRYIEMKETNNQLSDAEALLLSNYETVKKVKDSLDQKIVYFKKTAQEAIAKELGLLTFQQDGSRGKENGFDTYHFYEEQWYRKHPVYWYFYVEYKFLTGDLNKIVFQRTIQKDKTDTILEFLRDKGVPYIDYHKEKWFVLDQEAFKCAEPILSQVWKDAFMAQAIVVLRRYKHEMSVLFEEFIPWLQQKGLLK